VIDREKLAEFLSDLAPEKCKECGGYYVDDATPKWVFREEICECEENESWHHG
jgi:hypothetical protein